MAARKTEAKPSAEAKTVAEKIADICGLCWPNGWPHLHHSAQCEHGTYDRDPEESDPEQTPASGPADPAATGQEKQQDPETPPTGDKTEA